MPRTIVYDTATRAILVIDPPVDKTGKPILPNGVNTAAAVTISDSEASKFNTANAQFSLAADGVTVTVGPAPPVDPAITAALQQHVNDAVTMLNSAAVMADQTTRDAFARQIGVKPLTIPITQKAVAADIHPGP